MTSYSTATTLVVVESPAKCKKIEDFLGPGYKCVASFGHLRELTSLNNIDLENNFHPTFTIADNKRKYISKLKKEIAEKLMDLFELNDLRIRTIALTFEFPYMYLGD